MKDLKESFLGMNIKRKYNQKNLHNNNPTRFYLDASFRGAKILFVLAFDDTDIGDNDGLNKAKRDSHRKYFLPRVNITHYNVLIDRSNFYDQTIIDQIKRYDEIRKIATKQGDDYTIGCLLDYKYFKDPYQLVAVDLIKQKELDADPRALQHIEFYGMLKTNTL